VSLRRTLLLLVLLSAAAPTALAAVLLVARNGGFDAHAVAAVAGSLVLAAVLAALVARGVTRPIADCVAGALDIARGRFGRQVPVSARNEIGDLAYTFNHMSRELAAYDGENQRLIRELERGYLETIRSLAAAVDAKDPYTRGHSERVAALAVEIGRELRLSAAALKALEYGGVLHDIGKIGIPERILHKPGPLDDDEWRLMKEHPVISDYILSEIDLHPFVRQIARSSHERIDGDGYPDGLKADAIPLTARIVLVADALDALTTDRPYRRARPLAAAMDELRAHSGTQFCPKVVTAVEALWQEHPEVLGAGRLQIVATGA
jgi:HD-GYP domain-containing protein (c-di-GMP phosphodiesterase class II)